MHLVCAFILHGDVTRADSKLVEIINDVRAKKEKKKKNQACISYLFREQSGSWREMSSTSARKEFSRSMVPPSHRYRALVESQPRCCRRRSSQVSPASSSLLQLLHLLLSLRASSTLAPRTDVMPGPGAARWPITESAGSKDRLRSTRPLTPTKKKGF